MAFGKQQQIEPRIRHSDTNLSASTSGRPDEAFRSIADAEFELAISELRRIDVDQERAVHQCRKAIKRLRALVRLGPKTPGIKRRKIDRRLRKAGRFLAPVRDASEVRKALENLLQENPQQGALPDYSRVFSNHTNTQLFASKACLQLKQADAEVSGIFADRNGWTSASVAAGIEATYARTVADMERFARKPGARRAHSWRKSVQRLKNQLRLFEAVFPQQHRLSRSALGELSDLLGEHNDLAVLRMRLKEIDNAMPCRNRLALRNAAKLRQRKLGRHALVFGQEVFRQPAEDFCLTADSK